MPSLTSPCFADCTGMRIREQNKRMKPLVVLSLVILVGLLCWGCMSLFHRLRYGIVIQNIGNTEINVDSFKLYDSHSEFLIGTGLLSPGNKTGTGYLSEKPYPVITIRWTKAGSTHKYQDRVAISLPKRFYDRHSTSDICIYINPDTERAYVAYDVFDYSTKMFILVDSDGNPFDLERIKSKAATE